MKKVVSLFLSIVMIVSVVASVDMSSYAITSGDFEYEILSDGTAKITGYNGSDKDLIVPSSIDGYVVSSIGYYAFSGNDILSSIKIPSCVTKVYDDFYCDNLENIYVDENNSAYLSEDGILFNKDKTILIRYPSNKQNKSYTVPNNVITIEHDAFCSCSYLEEIIIPSSVKYIGQNAFCYCTNLRNITIPENVQEIYYNSFNSCSNLERIDVNSQNPYYSSQNGVLFSKDKSELITYPSGFRAKSYEIPRGVLIIREFSFYDCPYLEKIVISDSVERIESNAFSYCMLLRDINIPKSVKFITGSTFSYGNNLTNIDIDKDNQYFSFEKGVLYNKDKTKLIKCFSGITSQSNYIDIPTSVAIIGECSFVDCKFTTITIPNSVNTIEHYAFGSCGSLASITIPKSVKVIGDQAFNYCNKLTDIYYFGNRNDWELIDIDLRYSDECLSRATIHYNYNTDNNYTIKLYSAMPALTIGAGQEVNCAVQLENNGVPVSGNDKAAFEISVFDSNILTVSNIRKDIEAEQKGENGTWFALNGIKEGNTKLQIREINTGLVYETTVNVSNGILSFAANCMPTYYDHEFEYNGYVSGMYIDEFQYNKNQSTLSFDVYNSTSLMGVVEVYDSNGNLIDCEIIDRFDGNSVSSIKDSVVNMYKLVADGFKGELLTYKQDSYTKKTSINNLYVPKGGRIEITNNCMYSQSCAIANATELTVESLLTFSNSISDASKTKEIAKDTVKKIIKDSIKQDIFELGNKITEKIAEKTTEEVSKNLLNGALSEFVSDTITVFTAQNIDLDKIIIDSCKSVGVGIAENALKKAMGPAGLILDGLFLFSDYADLSSFYISIGKDNSSNSLYIYMPKEDNSLCDNGVVVKPEDNSSDFSDENYVLRSLVIEKNSTLPKKTWNELNKISNDYIVREIHIEKDGKETQPKGKMLVSILVPDDYKNAKYIFVYWIKDDGTLEKLSVPVTRQGNYLMFYVDHFSYYAIVTHNEHTFGNNSPICSVCGVANPNYAAPQPTQPTAPIQPSAPTPTIAKEKAPAGAKRVNGEWVAKKQKNAKIKKLTKAKKSFKATWKKVKGVSGYQIQYSTTKKFTKKTTKSVTIKKNKTTSKTVKKLKAKKKYYIRIRTYKNVKLNGKTVKVYSAWSKAKTVKTK